MNICGLLFSKRIAKAWEIVTSKFTAGSKMNQTLMKHLIFFLVTLIVVFGIGCRTDITNSAIPKANNPIMNDSLLAMIDFYYLNRGYTIQNSCNTRRKFISSDIIIKKMEDRLFLCILSEDSCVHNANKIYNNIINTLKYDSTGNVIAIYSGPVLFDSPQSFFTKDYRNSFVDSLFNDFDTLSNILKDCILKMKRK